MAPHLATIDLLAQVYSKCEESLCHSGDFVLHTRCKQRDSCQHSKHLHCKGAQAIIHTHDKSVDLHDFMEIFLEVL